MLRLCSTSCVRQRILSSFGIPFIVSENGFDEEQLCSKSPKAFAYAAALGKHQSALKQYGLELPLLIADSVVSCNGILQRKAKDQAQARAFLRAQSGGVASVISCAVLHLEKFFYVNVSQTHFEFGEFNEEAMESYLQSNAWRNKAGAVMVEGFHQKYIKKQIGTTSNALGLPMESLLPFLKGIV